ncbi:hypothetical protein HUU39_07230 [candidate division KSB1 bacterium]|nr:hypothetical protein [candidate division KSB1 bacterium]
MARSENNARRRVSAGSRATTCRIRVSISTCDIANSALGASGTSSGAAVRPLATGWAPADTTNKTLLNITVNRRNKVVSLRWLVHKGDWLGLQTGAGTQRGIK